MTTVINGKRVGRPPIHGGGKTKKMLAVEARLGARLEEALPLLVTDHGLSGAADYLGLSKATLGYWLLKMDIVVRRVALGPDDSLHVMRGAKTRN